MSDDWGKTTNLRLPKDKSEPDYGATVVNYRFQEEEEPRQTQQPPQQQQPPQKQGGGVPIWLWGIIAGFGGLVFLIIAGVLLYMIFAANPGFTLIIEGAPPNSRIFVGEGEKCVSTTDGKYICHDIRAGRRNVRVTCDGYADYNGSVFGNDGEEKRLPVTMAKTGGNGNNGGNNNGGNGKGNPIDEMGKRIEKELQEIGRTSVYGINFDFNSDKIKPESVPILKKIAEVLNKHPEWNITVEGHTDNKGSVEYNLKLSDRRAKAVKNFLTGAGVPPARLTSVGFGFGRPIASNETEDGQAKNRRVELVRDKK